MHNTVSLFIHHQRGQGLVEYAILLLLTITLVIGGIELAATAVSSDKATEAAKAGANEYTRVNETRLVTQTALFRYLEKLDRESATNSQIVEMLDNIVFDYTGYFWEAYQSNATQAVLEHDGADFEAIVDDGINTPITITGYANLQAILLLIDGILDDNGDGIIDSADRDDVINNGELYQALRFHQTLEIDDTDPANEDGINDTSFDILRMIKELDPITDAAGDLVLEEEYKIAKYQALILFEHIKLSILPLDPRIVMSESVPLLASHDVSLMSQPNCDDSTPTDIIYDHGFYGEDLDINGDGITYDGVPHMTIDGTDYPAIYLFNPLPIDIASCQGNDAGRDDKSMISILIDGYGNNGDVNDIETFTVGMPNLNQAYYSQYEYVCLDSAQQYTGCGKSNVATRYLKPPGKLCLTNSQSDTLDSCPGIDSVDPDYAIKNVTGYYFWGRGGSSSNGGRFEWVYAETTPPPFRPSFQLLCNGESVLSESIIGEECTSIMDSDDDGDIDGDDSPLNRIYQIEVNVRYRSVFESFLAFGMHELKDDADLGLKYYFYDPANLRALANNEVSGTMVGSELGPKQGELPTVKPFKDFRGCFDVDIETNQTSACN